MATTNTNETIMHETEEQKLAKLIEFIARIKTYEQPDSYLIRALHQTQNLYGYLPNEAMDVIAQEMGIPTAHIWGVATFYHYFNLNPPGKYTISVCLGTACYVKGAALILEAIKNELNIDIGETTQDMMFSLQPARCLGACGLAPVVMINDKIHGELTPKSTLELIKKYRRDASKK
ncbi:MAG: NADH-quinone oxidoreductase subunit NuoE [Sedimentisphaerales bacterium]|nr:NADH-quinone oxidoreductase subunit NuoE [Sedimentisphaerales bacterium]